MKKALIGIMIVSLMGGCAVVNRSYKLGNSSEINKQWDEAIAHYEKAVIENPKESVYRLALLRVKASAAMAALENARLLSLQGKKEEAAAAYRKALTYDPTNRLALTELEILTAPPSAVKEKSKPAPDVFELPVRLKVNDEKIQLKFTEASVRSIFLALGRHAGVNFIFDEQFRDVPLTIDLMDRTFDKALDFLCLASKNFSRIIDERTVIIVPDTPMTRMAYEWNAIKTFYLSNLNAQDVMNSLTNMVRTNIKQPILIMDKNLNSITIRDTPRTIALAEKLIRSWDKFRGEVVIDLEIMEVSRIREKDLGLNFSQSYANIQYDGNGTINESGQVPLKGLNLGKAENYLIGLPEVALKFLETDSDTKIIAQPRLRGIGSEEIKYVVGQQVPFTNTSFVPISSGGVNQQTVTSYEYKNVGIDVKIKPRIHIEEREVTLDLEIKITSLTETSISGIPIISTREIKNVIRLKDGETNLLAGLLKDEERQTLKGVTGVKHIPILGSLFSSTDRTVEQTDVILTITPHIIRTMSFTEEDEKPVWVENQGIPSGGMEESLSEGETMTPEGEAVGGQFVAVDPGMVEVPAGREFRLNIEIQSDEEIGNLALDLNFDPKVLRLKDVVEGQFMRSSGSGAPFMKNIDNGAGACTLGFSAPPSGKGARGAGILATLIFEGVDQGETDISLNRVTAGDKNSRPLRFDSQGAHAVVH